jgi:hypothetical protein
MMVLVQAGWLDQALHWADEAAAHDPGLGWSYNYGKGWVYLLMERFAEAADALRQTEFNDAHLRRCQTNANQTAKCTKGNVTVTRIALRFLAD